MTSAAQWKTQPMVLVAPGLNLWQFGPRAFRSRQPHPEEIDKLARQLHLTWVLDLTEEEEHSQDAEEAACEAVPINRARVEMSAGPEWPTQLQIDRALVYLGIEMRDDRPLLDENAPGCLVHCTHGEDRSGVVCACAQLCYGLPLATVLEDFRHGHQSIAGLWGEYWFAASILEFRERLKR